ncbi:hypothetical protein E2C01_015933 [Portunus trituberculatus]|uniref:Sulfotransferase domain-containing protein n=1 Tax=Portunus trituberculatus TaxID=210409 RepID=A0A5B7DPE7_PORTR|nr:hypothetical protein [Portunus trituberculatus]
MSRQLLSGHKVEQASEEEVKKMEMVPFVRGIVRLLPEGWLSDDVIVMTFPKCGTTWMQEIVWTMLHNPNLDNPEADESIWSRSHEISTDMIKDADITEWKLWNLCMEKFEKMCPGGKVEDGIYLQILEASAGPRVIRCHYPFSLLPPDMLQSAKVSEVEVELYPRITEVQAEFHVRISDLQAEFCRKSSVSEGRLCPTVTLPSKSLYTLARKPLSRVRKPNLHSDRGQDSSLYAWRPFGPLSIHGSTVPTNYSIRLTMAVNLIIS